MSGANLPPLKTRQLGPTNVSVTELGLGTAPLGDLFQMVEDHEAAAIIGAAWDGGVRYFDTSPWYGRDRPSTVSAGRFIVNPAANSSSRPRSAASCGGR
jgi:aryl-alcohol dehydrogenase-like predicted oxidoreductase